MDTVKDPFPIPLIRSTVVNTFSPTNRVRRKIQALADNLYKEFGRPHILEKLFSTVVFSIAHFFWWSRDRNVPNNPPTKINLYRVTRRQLRRMKRISVPDFRPDKDLV